MIEVRNLTKRYGKKPTVFTALENINLGIEAGTSVAIVGKSGSGKSTLMHVMSGLDTPSEGTVVIDGHDIATLHKKNLDTFRAEKIGFIFQAFFVQANETCSQNVALPLEIARVSGDERKRRISEALNAVGLSEKASVLAKNLSGGQKQRLAIARAIVNKPSIIFADEPTGNLDSATSDKIEELLFSFKERFDTTIVIVTHDEDLARKCDKQIRISDGHIQLNSGAKGRKV